MTYRKSQKKTKEITFFALLLSACQLTMPVMCVCVFTFFLSIFLSFSLLTNQWPQINISAELNRRRTRCACYFFYLLVETEVYGRIGSAHFGH